MKNVKNKIVNVMTYIYGTGILLALFVGALSFLGYVVAIIIGGETATEICTFIYKSFYPILITFTSCMVLFGLVKMYIAGEKALDNKKKKPQTQKAETGEADTVTDAVTEPTAEENVTEEQEKQENSETEQQEIQQ